MPQHPIGAPAVYLLCTDQCILGAPRDVGEDAVREKGVAAAVGVAGKIPHHPRVGYRDLVILVRVEHIDHRVVAPPVAEVHPAPLLVVRATGEAAVDPLNRYARSCHATAGAARTAVAKVVNGVALPDGLRNCRHTNVNVGISVWKP